MAKYTDEVLTVIKAQDESAVELRKAEQARREVADREKVNSREQAKQAKEVADVRAQITDASLRGQGKVLEADTAQIRRQYAERIRAARESGNAELADRLRTLAAIRQAEARSAEQSRADARKGGTGASGPGVDQQFFSTIGRIAAGAVLADTALQGLRAVSAGLEGDTEKLAEELGRLPIGLGKVFQLGQELRNLATGEREDIEAYNRLIAADIINQRLRLDLAEQRRVTEQRIAQTQQSLNDQLRVLNTPESDRESVQRKIAAQEAVNALVREEADLKARARDQAFGSDRREADDAAKKRLADLRGELDDAENRVKGSASELVRQQNQERLDALNKEKAALEGGIKSRADSLALTQEEIAAIPERIRLQEQVNAKIAAEAEEKKKAAAVKAVAGVDADLEQLALRRAGKTLEADLAANKTATEDRIARAKEAGNAELAERERVLGASREYDIKRQSAERDQQAAEARRAASANVEADIEQIQLAREGRVYDATLANIRRAATERINAAERAGDAELAAVERRRQREQEIDAQAAERLRQREQALDDQSKAADRDINSATEELQRAREAAQRAAAPENQANQDRFLTGVREDSASRDRVFVDGFAAQVKAAEKNLEELKQVKQGIADMIAELRNGPRIVPGVF